MKRNGSAADAIPDTENVEAKRLDVVPFWA
jgi:hypothetical protein